MTRWHESDLGGMLLEEMYSWPAAVNLKLPMEAEQNDPLGRAPGEPLWPEWFTDDMRHRRQARRPHMVGALSAVAGTGHRHLLRARLAAAGSLDASA